MVEWIYQWGTSGVIGTLAFACQGGGCPFLFAEFFVEFFLKPLCAPLPLFGKFAVKCFGFFPVYHKDQLFFRLSEFSEVFSPAFLRHRSTSLLLATL